MNDDFFEAVQFNNLKYVSDYLETNSNAILLEYNEQGHHALYLAISYSRANMLQLLLKYCNKNHINHHDKYKKSTALIYASKYMYKVETVKILLNFGADPDVQNSDGYTALHYACKSPSYFELIQCLLAAHANINIQTLEGKYPRDLLKTNKEREKFDNLVNELRGTDLKPAVLKDDKSSLARASIFTK